MKAVAERLGHTSTRMMDTVYVEVYADASAEVADAIDRLVEIDTENLTRDGLRHTGFAPMKAVTHGSGAAENGDVGPASMARVRIAAKSALIGRPLGS